MDRATAIRHVFGSAAERYAASAIHAGGPDLDAMLAAAELAGGEAVLDLGCGTGHTALAFAARGAEVEALDLTAEMLDQGRRMAEERGLANVRFREGDAARLPFADGAFDVVTSRLSAHHYARPEAAVREAARVLRPGGRLLLVDSVAPADPAQDTFLNAIEVLRDPSHVRDHAVGQWCAMFAAAGLAPEILGTWSFRIAFDEWVARVATPALEVAQLRSLLARAPDDVRAALRIAADGSFDIPAALIRGRTAAQGRTQIS
jgi:ubiquinone/menaquinone biosynthesis C-methylase UbiE